MMGPEKSLAKAGSSNYTHEEASWSAHTRSITFVLWGVSAPTNVRLFVSSFTMTRKHSPEARRGRLGSQDTLHSRFVRSKVTLLRSESSNALSFSFFAAVFASFTTSACFGVPDPVGRFLPPRSLPPPRPP